LLENGNGRGVIGIARDDHRHVKGVQMSLQEQGGNDAHFGGLFRRKQS